MNPFFSPLSFFKKQEELPVLKELPSWQERMKNPTYLSVHIADTTPGGRLRHHDQIRRRL